MVVAIVLCKERTPETKLFQWGASSHNLDSRKIQPRQGKCTRCHQKQEQTCSAVQCNAAACKSNWRCCSSTKSTFTS